MAMVAVARSAAAAAVRSAAVAVARSAAAAVAVPELAAAVVLQVVLQLAAVVVPRLSAAPPELAQLQSVAQAVAYSLAVEWLLLTGLRLPVSSCWLPADSRGSILRSSLWAAVRGGLVYRMLLAQARLSGNLPTSCS